MESMIAARVAKLKFIIEDMQLALHLTTLITDPFVARTLARHVLIRAKDFIEHSRSLRKPLNLANYPTGEFHEAKEDYAHAFDDYFQDTRDRLSAHVQDFDFGKRVALWNDIEMVKIDYFVEAAADVYRKLLPLNLPGYVAYANPAELVDMTVTDTLRQYQRSLGSRDWMEIGTDPLALSRNNTSAVINTTPIHARAGQIVLIKRWISIQTDLLSRFAVDARIALQLKARIITDIVSFCDCLVTRLVEPGAPQAMDGLNALIRAHGGSPAAIDSLVAVTNFHAELDAAREVRNCIGAHIEVDPTRDISSLIEALKGYDLEKGLSFYSRAEAAFKKVCYSILYLRLYVADGTRIYGASSSGTRAVPYSGDQSSVAIGPPPSPRLNDADEYRRHLTCWLDGDAHQKAGARDYFLKAFSGSEILETIDESQGGPKQSFRRVHELLHSVLSTDLSDDDFYGVLDLMLSCRGIDPYALSEVLVRYGQRVTGPRLWNLCEALGEFGSAPHASVESFLKAHSASSDSLICLQAVRARFKIFVKTEGLFRVNHQGRTRADFDSFVGALTAQFSTPGKMICSLIFAAALSDPRTGPVATPFRANYAVLQKAIQGSFQNLLANDRDNSTTDMLKKLIDRGDYLGVCVLVANGLKGGKEHRFLHTLIECCCNGLIASAGHDDASRHRALCFYLKKDYIRAFQVAQEVATRSPEWVDLQILVAEILTDTPDADLQAEQKVAYLRRTYPLTAEFEQRVVAIEAELASRRNREATRL